MSRSVWKGPFVDGYLLKKAEKVRSGGRSEVIKIWSRRSTILPQFVGLTFGVYNGQKHVPVNVTEDMIGHKFGEFSPTRTFHSHSGDKKATKRASKKAGTKKGRVRVGKLKLNKETVKDLTPGPNDVPPFSLGGQDDYAISPDSNEVAFSMNVARTSSGGRWRGLRARSAIMVTVVRPAASVPRATATPQWVKLVSTRK